MVENSEVNGRGPISLRDFFEMRIAAVNQRIDHLETHWKEINEQKEAARKVALVELERRLEALNHAHQRAIEVLATYLTREAWEKFREEDATWKRQDEVIRASLVTDTEFITYKETTQQALTLAVGKSQGIGSVWAAVVIGFSVLAAIGTVSTAVITLFFKH